MEDIYKVVAVDLEDCACSKIDQALLQERIHETDSHRIFPCGIDGSI
jgi:hypothetical protein